MQYENIEYEKRGATAYVTLNRPDKLNALSPDLQLEVRHALEDAGWADDDIRVIVLKAAGRAFSAGFDITTSPPADWPLQPSAISGFVPKTPSSAHRKYAPEAPTFRLSGHGSSA